MIQEEEAVGSPHTENSSVIWGLQVYTQSMWNAPLQIYSQ